MRLPKTGTIEIAPSILSADFARLADEMAVVESAGLAVVHLDVMDGHFVPNITFGPPVISKLRKTNSLVFDSHLMISEPAKYAEAFVEAGSDHITFHIEADDQPKKLSVEAIEKVATLCDMVLVMTVHPGFGGQEFIAAAAEKIGAVREIVGPNIRVEVDGGIDAETAPMVVGYGADTLVAGNAIFSKTDRIAAIEAIREAAR